MKIATEAIEIKRVVPTSSGTGVFLGNKRKTFLLYVDNIMGEQIDFAFKKQTQPRPFTSDFIRYILCSFEIAVKSIIIYDEKEGTFYAKVILQQEGSCTRIVEMDVRPSDAILLSLSMNKPVYVTQKVFDSIQDSSDILKNLKSMES